MTLPLTPAMRQYVEIKSCYRDCILFFRMGDFYEMFFEDALRASRLLDIALTSRDKESNIPMCGVPHHARNAYLSKLIRQGCKVAICEQIEEPGQKGIFRREVTEVVTPGLVFSEECLDARGNNFLAAVRFAAPSACAALDATTGEFFRGARGTEEALADALFRLGPAEFVALEGEGNPASSRGKRLLEGKLLTTLSPSSLSSFPAPPPAGGVVRAVLYSLPLPQPSALSQIGRVAEREGRRHLAMDETAVRTLEVFSTMSGDRKGSLLWAVDRTRTPMGARLLRAWLAAPLLDVERIGQRHDAVGELIEEEGGGKSLASTREPMGALSRQASRLAQDRSGPRDVAALRDGLAAIPGIKAALGERYAKRLQAVKERLGDHVAAVDRISSALADLPPAGYKEGGVFRPGYDARVDELTHLLTHGKGMLAEMETRENAERFITPELKEFEGRVLRAQEGRAAREEELFLALRDSLKGDLPAIAAAAEAIAELDVLLSFAELAAENGYGRPAVNAGREILIENGRHPVVEKILGRHAFVPNDCRLSPDGARLAIITRPNMAGKSTYIRQAALIVLLAHAGSFVPADRAEIGLVDRIFTRIGASDDLSRGESTFMVEMRETARILDGVTDRTLVVLDEGGRGTSTYDGLSIAWAVAEYLHDSPARPKVLFATHFHELTDIVSTCANARNFHVAVPEWQGDIIFLRRIDEGIASKSYGIQVARLAGLPASVVDRSRDILKNLESAEYNEDGFSALAGTPAAP